MWENSDLDSEVQKMKNRHQKEKEAVENEVEDSELEMQIALQEYDWAQDFNNEMIKKNESKKISLNSFRFGNWTGWLNGWILQDNQTN